MSEKLPDNNLLKIVAGFVVLFSLAVISPFLPLVGMVTIVPWLVWKSIKKN